MRMKGFMDKGWVVQFSLITYIFVHVTIRVTELHI